MVAKRYKLTFLLQCFVFFCSITKPLYADTHTAANATHGAVTAAIAAAASGDLVIVPPGAATWSQSLVISKGITLQGSGIGVTVITSNISNNYDALVTYTPANPSLNERFRLTAFTFEGAWKSGGVIITNSSATALINGVRVDHLRFYECNARGVVFWGNNYGLVDHNIFEDCYVATSSFGNEWSSWENYPLHLGTDEYVVFEDNTFTFTGFRACAFVCEGGQGGRYTFRYNTIRNPIDGDILDIHGNQDPVTPAYRSNGSRGTVGAEIYNNTVYSTRTNHRFVFHRGGTALVFNNTFTGTSQDVEIQLTEYDGWSYHYLSMYPGYDQIQNSYYWNNKDRYGMEMQVTLYDPVADSVFIQNGRDFWLTPPPNYTPLRYPHPMITPLRAPQKLRIVP